MIPAGIVFIVHGVPKLSRLIDTEHFFANMEQIFLPLHSKAGTLELVRNADEIFNPSMELLQNR
jgi:hypothetical protein